MTFQPAPNCTEAVINGLSFGKPIANVLNFDWGAVYSQSDLDNLAAAVDAAVNTYYIPYLPASVAYVNTTVRGLANVIDLISIDNTSAGPGTDGGAPNPNNVTMCFRLNTGHTGRSARGRFYAFPATSGQMSDANNFLVTYADAIVDLLDNIASAAFLAGCTLSVLSRQNNNVVLATAVTLPVLSIDYRNRTVDSMRGRLTVGH